MNINGTFIIQIINFGVAYLLLRIFFIKPVVAVIATQRLQQDTMDAHINQSQAELDSIIAERRRLLSDAHLFFQTHAPIKRADQMVFRGITPPLVLHEASAHERAQLAQVVTGVLSKRLKEDTHG